MRWTVVFLLFAVSVVCANDISAENEQKVLAQAQRKSLNIYHGLVSIADAKLKKAKKVVSRCWVENRALSQVSCEIVDVHEQFGWSQGVVVKWTVEHAGQDKATYWPNQIEFIAH